MTNTRQCTPISPFCHALFMASVLIMLPTHVSAQTDSGFLQWSDTSLSLLPWGDGYAIDPEEQSAITLEHAHGSSIGDLFLFVDLIKYYDQGGDDTSWYMEIGPRVSLGKTLGKSFAYAPLGITDLLMAAQYERGEDPDVAEAALLGVGFDLDVADSALLDGFNYVQLNIYGRAEMTEGTDSGIRDAQVTLVASYPFSIGGAPMLIDGYFDWVLGIGDQQWSYHLNPQLTTDLGARWDNPGMLFVGAELDFWWNKYQVPDSAVFDTNQAAASLLVKYHF